MNRMKLLREEMRINMREAARRLNIPYTTYVNYEKGLREPGYEMLIRIAAFYHCSIDYLLGNSAVPTGGQAEGQGELLSDTSERPLPPDVLNLSNIYPIELKRFPLLGDIACGQPIAANEERECYVSAASDIHADFCLRASGDSMVNARILDGDIVFIKKQDMVEPGSIAAVLIGDDVTLKRVYYDREAQLVQLIAENPSYPPMVYSGEKLNEIRILGKAVAFQSCL